MFAAWVSTRKLEDEFIDIFNKANSLGLLHLNEIIAANPFEIYDLRKYYTLHINYNLDQNKRKSLEKFLGLIT